MNSPKAKKRKGSDEVAPQHQQTAPRWTEIPDRWFRHLHPVGHGHDILGIARQVASPFLELSGLHPTAVKDDSFLDPDSGVSEPFGGFQDALEPLADLFIACDRLDVHLRGRRGYFVFDGKGRFLRFADAAGWLLRTGRRDQRARYGTEQQQPAKELMPVRYRSLHGNALIKNNGAAAIRNRRRLGHSVERVTPRAMRGVTYINCAAVRLIGQPRGTTRRPSPRGGSAALRSWRPAPRQVTLRDGIGRATCCPARQVPTV